MKNQSIIPSLQQTVNFFAEGERSARTASEETIDQIAKETGFSVRKRKLPAIVFIGACDRTRLACSPSGLFKKQMQPWYSWLASAKEFCHLFALALKGFISEFQS